MPTSDNPSAPAGDLSSSSPVVPDNGSPYIAIVQALSLSLRNAANQQQQMAATAQAAVTSGISTLYSLDTASTGLATKRILD